MVLVWKGTGVKGYRCERVPVWKGTGENGACLFFNEGSLEIPMAVPEKYIPPVVFHEN